MSEENGRYLVLVGSARYVSSFVNKGHVVERKQVIHCGDTMAAVLLREEFMNPKTNEMSPMWRAATQKEIDAHVNRLSTIDPATADPSLLAEAARREALARGEVETEAARLEHRRAAEMVGADDELPEAEKPKRRRRGR
jgi:hypothetical protein